VGTTQAQPGLTRAWYAFKIFAFLLSQGERSAAPGSLSDEIIFRINALPVEIIPGTESQLALVLEGSVIMVRDALVTLKRSGQKSGGFMGSRVCVT
jgi:hypothetical protein